MACLWGVAVLGLAALPAAADADSEESHSCLAQTLYFEAKSEGRQGMVAVGWVILNRMRDGEFPRSICGVVKQGREKPGCQFSYWCDGSPTRRSPTTSGCWRRTSRGISCRSLHPIQPAARCSTTRSRRARRGRQSGSEPAESAATSTTARSFEGGYPASEPPPTPGAPAKPALERGGSVTFLFGLYGSGRAAGRRRVQIRGAARRLARIRAMGGAGPSGPLRRKIGAACHLTRGEARNEADGPFSAPWPAG